MSVLSFAPNFELQITISKISITPTYCSRAFYAKLNLNELVRHFIFENLPL